MSQSSPQATPRRIVVDLTPLLPGGENGGARIFVLELLDRLAAIAPETSFILLTQAASHAELAVLDRPNMERRQVVGALIGQTLRPRLIALAARILPRLPSWAGRALGALAYGINARLKRLGSRRLLTELDADLLYCPFTAPTYHEPGIPTVCTLYDLQYLAFPEFFTAEDRANRAGTFAAVQRDADLIIAISEHARVTAISQGALNPGRIRTVPLRLAQRLNREPTSEPDRRIVERLGLVPGRYLLYPANFWPHKNHARLLTAFESARARGLPDDLVLVCTGAPGTGRAGIQERAERLGLTDRVRLPGYLDDADLAELLDRAAGLVFPSLYEGFGLPVVEAMAAGVPVACSAVTALPEVVGEAAVLFDPLDPESIAAALLELTLNDSTRARLIQAGRRRAAHFADSRAMALEYWDAFCEATAP